MRPDAGAARGNTLDGERAAELSRSLAHRAQPDPGTMIVGNTAAIVCHLNLQSGFEARQANLAAGGSRVMRSIGEGLGADAESCRLDCCREPLELAGDLYRHTHACRLLREDKRASPLPEGADQPELVQGGRSKPVDQPADIGDHTPDLLGHAHREVLRRIRIRRAQPPGFLKPKNRGTQFRPHAVVEIASQSAALLLPGEDELLPGSPRLP